MVPQCCQDRATLLLMLQYSHGRAKSTPGRSAYPRQTGCRSRPWLPACPTSAAKRTCAPSRPCGGIQADPEMLPEACPVRTVPTPQQWGQLQCSRRRAREGQAWGAQFGEYDHQRVLVVLFLHGRECGHCPSAIHRKRGTDLAHSPLLRPYPVPLVTDALHLPGSAFRTAISAKRLTAQGGSP